MMKLAKKMSMKRDDHGPVDGVADALRPALGVEARSRGDHRGDEAEHPAFIIATIEVGGLREQT